MELKNGPATVKKIYRVPSIIRAQFKGSFTRLLRTVRREGFRQDLGLSDENRYARNSSS